MAPAPQPATGAAHSGSPMPTACSPASWRGHLQGTRASHLPGTEGGYGHAVDGLEGFARSFLLAGFRIAGERGQGLDELIEFYARGIATGVDPSAPDRWVRLDEHPQAKVEAASIALILDLTREWIWDRLDGLTRERVIDYLSPVVGDTSYPADELGVVSNRRADLPALGRGPLVSSRISPTISPATTLSSAQDGWLSDGDERSFDHYVGWALHLYPDAVGRMQGATELAQGRTTRDVAALDRFLLDAVSAGRRRRLSAHPGPQPHLPLRRRRALLGRRARRGALALARDCCAVRPDASSAISTSAVCRMRTDS